MKRDDWIPADPGPGGGAMRVARACVLLLALVMPFSIAATEGALLTGLAALAVSRWRGRRFTFTPSWLEPASAALIAAWLLASAFSPAPLASLVHVRKLYALGLVWLVAEAAREVRVRARIVPLVLAGTTLTSLAGFAIYAAKIQSEADYRLQSVLSNQMTSGGVLCAAALWGLGALAAGPVAARSRAHAIGFRLAVGVVLVPTLAALVLTETRSHWLGFAAGACVIAAVMSPRRAWVLPLGGVLAVALAPHRYAARLASIVDPHEPGNQGRLSMWRAGLDIVRDHPVFGAGCQDLLALFRRYRYPDWTFESGHFHNNLVQVAVMSGLTGLAAFLLWLVAGARQLLRAVGSARGADRGIAAAALAVFVALLVGGMFDFTFGDAEVVYHTYLALGLALAILPSRLESEIIRERGARLDAPPIAR